VNGVYQYNISPLTVRCGESVEPIGNYTVYFTMEMEVKAADKPLASLVMRATWISTLMGINKRTEQTIICGVLGITHEEMQDLGLATLSKVATNVGVTFARDDGPSLIISASHLEIMQRVFDTHLMNESVAGESAPCPRGCVWGPVVSSQTVWVGCRASFRAGYPGMWRCKSCNSCIFAAL
jgi:hypothetical protein